MKRDKLNWFIRNVRDSLIAVCIIGALFWIVKVPSGLEWWRFAIVGFLLALLKPFL